MDEDPRPGGRRRGDPRVLVAAALVISLGLVAGAWFAVEGAVQRAVDDRFARLVADVTTQIDERLGAVETATVATRGLLDGGTEVTGIELSRFADALALGRPLAERFPGLRGIAITDPDGEVVLTAPASDAVTGLAVQALADGAAGPALERATDLALPVTASLAPDAAPGLVVAAARYGDPAADAPTATTAVRRDSLEGHVVALVDVEALLDRVLAAPSDTAVTLETSAGSVLQTAGDVGTAHAVRDRIVLLSQLGQGSDALRARVTAASGALGGTDPAPTLVLLLGVPLALALSALVWLLATQRERALRRVEVATAALTQSNHELEQSNARLRDFAGVVAHDLRGPLTSIQGMAQLLDLVMGDELAPREADIIARIQRSTAAMAQLIGDVLRYAESDVTSRDLEAVALADLTRQVLEHIEASIGDEDTVDVDVEGTVRVDPTGIRRLLANVIGNALKHGRRDDRPVTVAVRSRRIDDRIVIDITDDGPGIPPDEREQVLEPFQRGTTSARGSGLGLAISTRVVTSHGGSFELDDAPGGGTLVRFDLPAV